MYKSNYDNSLVYFISKEEINIKIIKYQWQQYAGFTVYALTKRSEKFAVTKKAIVKSKVAAKKWLWW